MTLTGFMVYITISHNLAKPSKKATINNKTNIKAIVPNG